MAETKPPKVPGISSLILRERANGRADLRDGRGVIRGRYASVVEFFETYDVENAAWADVVVVFHGWASRVRC